MRPLIVLGAAEVTVASCEARGNRPFGWKITALATHLSHNNVRSPSLVIGDGIRTLRMSLENLYAWQQKHYSLSLYKIRRRKV